MISGDVMPFVRGSNPIWFEVDLDANAFDDTYYLFVLQNTIPYLPAAVYHSENGTEWTYPIRFLANGTLPVDIFFDQDVVYRLEFRRGPTQDDPLIYLVENYSPTGSGGSPSGDTSITTDNQITNPQFSLVNFASTTTLASVTDPNPILVAPGWILTLQGTGTVVMAQEALTDSSTTVNPTNAPYALRLTLSGTFTAAYLSQIFAQNGNLWSSGDSDLYLATSVTARVQGSSAVINAIIVNSEGETLSTVLVNTTINEDWNEYVDLGIMPQPQDGNVPPASYLEYRLNLPTAVDIYLTSFQLIAEDLPQTIPYQQDSIQRQIDHTFHLDKPILEFKPIPSYLVGWDFPFNPCQELGLNVGPQSVGANSSYYVADQTIIFQTANNSITARFDSVHGMYLSPATATSFSVIQYIETDTAADIIQYGMSLGIGGYVSALGGTPITGNLRMYWTQSTLPDMNTNDSLVTSITNGIPNVVAGWDQIERTVPGEASFTFTGTGSLAQQFSFPGFNATQQSNLQNVTYIAVVATFVTTTSANEININYISLCKGAIATVPAAKSFSETLIDCQYFYQKSFVQGVSPAQNVGANTGETRFVQTNSASQPSAFPINFLVPMITTPDIATYNPVATNAEIHNYSVSGDYSATAVNTVNANNFTLIGTSNGGSAVGNIIGVNWTADARLGIV